ncbi:MAG TPA: NAD(P)-dependent oxidoreductase [Steroidobacteraceae bacterium]|nr:NAD(P)-dependent oxidoreductase [Steroidobacteraceae bacterium]
MRIGFLGLGRMGSAMATRLLGAGHALAVFDVSEPAAARMAAAGATVRASLRDLAGSSDVVLSMLPDDETLRAATLGPQGLVGSLAAGAIHVVSGTHGVQVIDQIAAAHRAAHQVLVTCHVLGRPDLAASGKLGLVPAGPPDALRALQPLFAVLGERIFEAGEDPLAATALKVANNYVLGCAIEAIGEGMAMVRKYGVDPQVFYRVLVEGLFDCTAYRAYADIIAKMDWGRIGATAVIGLKDAVLSRQAADKVHMTLPSLAAWQTHLEHAIARGEANLDWSVMAREQFRESGLEE